MNKNSAGYNTIVFKEKINIVNLVKDKTCFSAGNVKVCEGFFCSHQTSQSQELARIVVKKKKEKNLLCTPRGKPRAPGGSCG